MSDLSDRCSRAGHCAGLNVELDLLPKRIYMNQL